MLRFLATFSLCFLLGGCQPADLSAARAQYQMGMQYLQGSDGVTKDNAKAVELLTQAANAGLPDAQVVLGFAYMKGQGVTANEKKGFDLFMKAAKAGNRDAQYNVGLSYVRGNGVASDLVKAVDWFMKAAMQGDSGAQYNLGVMYANGEGTKQDSVEAAAWLGLAVNQKYPGAEEDFKSALKALTEQQRREAEARATNLQNEINAALEKQRSQQLQMQKANVGEVKL